MKIVIVEDEGLTARDLERTLRLADKDAEVVAILSSVEEGIAYFCSGPQVDLIFSDIQLGDGLSFDIYKSTVNAVPIVFCTAFDQYALQAFESAGIDYLLKPFNPESVGKALAKFKRLTGAAVDAGRNLDALLKLLGHHQSAPKLGALIIHAADKIVPLDIEKIALFYTENACTFAFTFEGKEHLVSESLELLEKSLSGGFFRANRQYLVSRKAVKDASRYFNRKLVLNLNLPFKEQILIGKLKATSFIEWLSRH